MAELWLRGEQFLLERRTPLTPEGAKILLQAGHKIVVESSISRVYQDNDYKNCGCTVVEAEDWKHHAPHDAFILGLGPLIDPPRALVHHHIYRSHLYDKSSEERANILKRFFWGNGRLLDFDHLTDSNHRQMASFGKTAGFYGAMVSLLAFCHKHLNKPGLFRIEPEELQLERTLQNISGDLNRLTQLPHFFVMGASGRAGFGVKELLEEFKLKATFWDREESQGEGPFKEILHYEIFINSANLTEKSKPFLTSVSFQENKRLELIVNIYPTLEETKNPIPFINKLTTFYNPIYKVEVDGTSLDTINIENLALIAPKESSDDFSSQLTPHLLELLNSNCKSPLWEKAANQFLLLIEEYTKQNDSPF